MVYSTLTKALEAVVGFTLAALLRGQKAGNGEQQRPPLLDTLLYPQATGALQLDPLQPAAVKLYI